MKMNKVELIGNLTRDVDLTTTPSGEAVARFTIAVQRRYTNQDGVREADFVNCVVWRNQAENLAKYCHKGDKIAVVGEVRTRTYEVDGEKRFTTEILANEIEFINTKKQEEQPTEEMQPVDDGSLPF